MDLQKVYEKVDYGEGYGHTKVGLRVDDHVIWFAFMDSPRHEEQFIKMESLIDEIVKMCGNGNMNR